MAKTALYFSFFFFLLLSCSGQNQTGRKQDSSIVLPSRGFCAHRGAMKTHPENTIPAFKAAINAGAQMIEMDVWLTKDKQMVIIHDNTVNRTTNGSGKVSGLTLADIKELDAGSWKSPEFKGVQIPTFEETLKIMPRNIWLNIHVKDDDETAMFAAQALKKANRLNQSFLACSANAAKTAKEICPDIFICNMDRQNSTDEYVANTIALGVKFIQLKGEITPEFEKQINIHVNYFGTDSPEKLKQLFQYQVDFPLVNDIVHTIQLGKNFNIKPVIPEF